MEKYRRARQAVGDNTIRRMRIAGWKHEAIDLHSEYAILITFPRKQLLRQCVSMLRL